MTISRNTDDLHGTVFISDNLPLLRSLDSESVDLVCIDPPFAQMQTFKGTLTEALNEEDLAIERKLLEDWEIYDATEAYEKGIEYPDQEGRTALFSDIWSFESRIYEDTMRRLGSECPGALSLIEASRATHSDAIGAYLAFMAERLVEIRRVLRPHGSVFVHCDQTANSYLRQLMDAVFGAARYRDEVVWYRAAENLSRKKLRRAYESILYYSKSDERVWNELYRDHDEESLANYKWEDDGGRYTTTSCTNNADRPNMRYEFNGHVRQWRFSRETMARYAKEGRLVYSRSGLPRRKDYLKDSPGVRLTNVWDDIKVVASGSLERTGYPTQKPWALAERIIELTTEPGQLVLDCFAGCAYVPVAAQLTGRRWLACDMSPRAWTMVRKQFHKHPDLGIVTQGDIPVSESAGGSPFRDQQPTLNNVIKVRGPDELPERTELDVPTRRRAEELSPVRFKRRPEETNQEIWQAFVDEWGAQCWYCWTVTLPHRQVLHLDHIEPNRRDGTNDDCWNRALACTICNGNKSDRLNPEQTIRWAFEEEGLIPTEARFQEVREGFRTRHAWAVRRWKEEVLPIRRARRGC